MLDNYTALTLDQTAIITEVKRSYSASDLDTLSLASNKYTCVLITSPESTTGKFCAEKIEHGDFLDDYKSNAGPWSFRHCNWGQGGFYHCLITPKEAMKIPQGNTSLKDYHRGLELEKIAAEKTSASNLEIGLSEKKIRPLGQRSFYLYNYQTSLKIHKINNLSHTEEALSEDCDKLLFSSKEELLRFCAHTFHQLDALHEAGIYHMDIKPANICKTKNNSFKIIDLNDCLDFSNEGVFDRVKQEDFSRTPEMIPYRLLSRLLEEKDPNEVLKLSGSCDLFATGSTIYQIAYAFLEGLSVAKSKEQSPEAIYPYRFFAPETHYHPARLKPDLKLDETLKIFNTRQKELIKAMLSSNLSKMPTLKVLKEVFPILH